MGGGSMGAGCWVQWSFCVLFGLRGFVEFSSDGMAWCWGFWFEMYVGELVCFLSGGM